MIIVVNGYVCTSLCEAAKARHGQDPHTPPGQLPNVAGKKSGGLDNQPAVVFGGALKGAANSSGAASVLGASSAPSSPANIVNLLV